MVAAKFSTHFACRRCVGNIGEGVVLDGYVAKRNLKDISNI